MSTSGAKMGWPYTADAELYPEAHQLFDSVAQAIPKQASKTGKV